ncbi:hypothetical protein BVRB_6g156370 [Beta vulgaris subsp. vulgaris]|uniref:CCHC-type domain-containing protein n=1 Tax=Beta vulgaris subsp. vulgaris TaxID=3555 RepID=A0A0J8B8I1_BETVV|nr:hypothetical protein BVRB_6g156370 [Beta vulgaris subsp. vulgaris]
MKQGGGSLSQEKSFSVSARGRKGNKLGSSHLNYHYCDERGYMRSQCPKAKADSKKLKESKGKTIVAQGEDTFDDEEYPHDALLVVASVVEPISK